MFHQTEFVSEGRTFRDAAAGGLISYLDHRGWGDNLMTLMGYQLSSSLFEVHLRLKSANRKCKSDDAGIGANKIDTLVTWDSSGCNYLFFLCQGI